MNDPVRRLLAGLFGNQGERTAARFLKRQGYRILTQGYRIRRGEIDLIALDAGRIVFVEVKTRRSGSPAEAVTLEKQRNLTRAALHFLKRHHLLDQPSRFDVVAIVWPDDSREPTIQHFRNAFPAANLPRSSF